MNTQWNAEVVTPVEEGAGTKVLDNQSNVQPTLEAGSNITIANGEISASGGGAEYTAGSGISIDENTISVDSDIRSGAAAGATAVQAADLATVATSGSYDDLLDKPSIPAAQVNSDWNAASGVAQILNKPSLATVATSGSYDDLINKPSIPAAQIQSDWNQTNDQSADYIKNKPSIPAAQVNADWDAVSGAAQILNKPTIPTVAQSYNALSTDAMSGTAVAEAISGTGQVPSVTSGDNGKVLKATYEGGVGSFGWDAAPSGVPSTTSSDEGKVLGVTDNQGSLGWVSQPSIPTVDQVYNSASTNAQSGTAVAGALSSVNQVPSSTSADENKVLTVNSSGNAVWADAQSGADVTVDTANNNIEFGDDIVLHYTVTDSGSMSWTGSRNEFSGTSFEWRWDNSEPAPSANLTLTIPNNISRTGNAITSVVFKDVSNATCTVSGGTLLSNGVIQAGTYTVTASSAATTVLIKAIVTFTNSLAPMDATMISAAFDETTLGISGGTPTADLMPNVARTSSDNGKVLGVTDNQGSLGWVSQTAAQVNSDWNASSGVSQILNKPSLATVATSGSYDDLTNKPSIPAAQVNSDWDAVSGAAQILNKPSLATVATSGSYADLSNKPSIPAAQVNSDWNAVSGVSQILNKPTIPTVDQSYSASSTNAQSGVAVANAISAVNQVPSSTSADEDKVLTVNASGNPVWATAQTGSSYTFSNPIKETSGTVSLDYDTDTLSASTTSWTQFDTFNSSTSGQAVFRASDGGRLVDILNYGEPNSTISLHIPGNAYFSANYASSQSYFISLSTDSSIDRNPERTITYIGHPLATEQITVSGTPRTAVAEQDVVINFADLSDTSLWTPKQFNFTGYVYLAIVMDYSDTTSIANAPLTSVDDAATVPVKYSATTAAPLTVKNPIPSFSTSTDAGKVLTVGSNGTEWVNSVPIEVVAALPASPTSGVLYIVTGS